MMDGPITPNYILTNILDPIQADGSRVTRITCHISDYMDLTQHPVSVIDFNFNINGQQLKQGFVGRIWGVKIYISKRVIKDHFEIISSKLGRTRKLNWCGALKEKFRAPFCKNPLCSVSYVHET